MRRALLATLVFAASSCTCNSKLNPVHVSLTAEPTALDFGVIAPGTVAQKTLTLTAGGGKVTFDSITVSDDARHAFSIGVPPTSAEPGAPATLTVTYAPGAEGADAASVVVSLTSDGLNEVVVPLVGRALVGADAGSDAGTNDGGSVDAGTDAGFDGGTDAGTDAGMDAGLDAGTDAGFDAGFDAGSPYDGGLIIYDGGACMENMGLGNTRWTSFGKAYFPELLWNGSAYDAIFYDINESYAGHVDGLGQSVGSQITITGSPGAASVLVRSARGADGGIGIVFADDRAGLPNRATYFAQVSPSLSPIPNTEILVQSTTVDAPNVAWNPADQEWAVEYSVSPSSLFFARIDSTGALISGSQRTLSTNAIIGRAGDTRSMVWTGNVWAVAWSEGQSIVLEEVDRSGNLVAASKTTVVTIPTPDQVFDPAIAVGPSEYMVGWQDNRGGVAMARARVARVGFGGGLVPNSEVVVGEPIGLSDAVDVIWDGHQYFVAHGQQDGTEERVAIATLDVNGNITTASHIVTCLSPGANEFNPRITWNGQVHAIAYTYQGTIVEGRTLLVP